MTSSSRCCWCRRSWATRVNGVIVLSSIGYGKFDEQDLQMVEVLAPHAAAAFENATLLAAEREAARTSAALLALSQALVGRHTVGDIFQEAIESIPSLMPCAAVGAYVRNEETGDFRVARLHVVEPGLGRPRAEIADVPAAMAESFLVGRSRAVHTRRRRRGSVAPRALDRGGGPFRADRAPALGPGRLRSDRDDRG